MTDRMELPPAACVVTHEVADFDVWKQGFDDHEHARRAAGILGHHINRDRANPNRLSIYCALSDMDKAKKFTASDDLRETMQSLGVLGPPEVRWMAPLREAVVWDRELPAFMLAHSVSNVDQWLPFYDAADELRQANGIIGQAANHSLDDPSVTVVYHQAESFDTLEAFLANPELKERMEEAGVTSAPDVQMVTGGWAKLY